MKSIAITGMSLQLLRLNQPCRQGSVYFIGQQSKVKKLDDERALAGWVNSTGYMHPANGADHLLERQGASGESESSGAGDAAACITRTTNISNSSLHQATPA